MKEWREMGRTDGERYDDFEDANEAEIVGEVDGSGVKRITPGLRNQNWDCLQILLDLNRFAKIDTLTGASNLLDVLWLKKIPTRKGYQNAIARFTQVNALWKENTRTNSLQHQTKNWKNKFKKFERIYS